MTDEPFDFTDLVKTFQLTAKSGEIKNTDGNIFTWEYPSPVVELNFTADSDLVFESMKQAHKEKAVIKMTQRGKYWFDYASEADVIMTDLELIGAGGEMTATYESMNIIDLTDYRPLARFLRWALRR